MDVTAPNMFEGEMAIREKEEIGSFLYETTVHPRCICDLIGEFAEFQIKMDVKLLDSHYKGGIHGDTIFIEFTQIDTFEVSIGLKKKHTHEASKSYRMPLDKAKTTAHKFVFSNAETEISQLDVVPGDLGILTDRAVMVEVFIKDKDGNNYGNAVLAAI